MRDPDLYKDDLDLPEIVDVWRRGSVISSWLLDLAGEPQAQAKGGGRFSRQSKKAFPWTF